MSKDDKFFKSDISDEGLTPIYFYSEDEEITIKTSEYEMLLKDSAILDMLIAGGVETWEGFEKAMGLDKLI